MFSFSQKFLFCFLFLMINLCSYECQDYNTFMINMYSFFFLSGILVAGAHTFFFFVRGSNPCPCINYTMSLPTELSSREHVFMLCLFIMFDLCIFVLCLKNVKKMSKLYPLETKTKTKKFVRMKNLILFFRD